MSSKSEKATYMVIIGKGDVPLYEAQLSSNFPKSQKDLSQFLAHMSLDSLDLKIWSTTNMFLRHVDRFDDKYLSAFVTAGHIKFILIHDHKVDENSIRQYFFDVYELYVKVLMNPFYEKTSPIVSKEFDDRVRELAKRLS